MKDGIFRQYRGARDKDSFIVYIEEKKWQSAEPVSDWKAPDSLQMSAVSYFFKLSMILRYQSHQFKSLNLSILGTSKKSISKILEK